MRWCGVIWVGVVAAGMGGVVRGEGKVPFTISKETTGIVGPLKADGTVDYVAALNEKYSAGVTPANNGFVKMLEVIGTGDNVISPKAKERVLKMCGAKEETAGTEVWESYEEFLKKRDKGLSDDELTKAEGHLRSCGNVMWTGKEEPEVAAYLRARERQLGAGVEAAMREKWWVPYVSTGDPPLLHVALPNFGRIREVGDALCARATLRAKAGDFVGFLGDIVAAKRLARHVGSGGSIIERLAGAAMDSHASEAVGAVAGTGILDVEQCRKLRKVMESLEPLAPMTESLDANERWMALDAITSLAMGVGDKEFAKVEAKNVDWDLVLKRMNGVVDENVAIAKQKGIWARRAADQLSTKKLNERVRKPFDWNVKRGTLSEKEIAAYTEAVGNLVISVFASDGVRTDELQRQAVMREDMARAVVGAAEFKAVKGQWPETLEELVPVYLSGIPGDIYSKDGQYTYGYSETDGKVRVYSIGQNARDDGGVMDREKGKDDIVVGVVEERR